MLTFKCVSLNLVRCILMWSVLLGFTSSNESQAGLLINIFNNTALWSDDEIPLSSFIIPNLNYTIPPDIVESTKSSFSLDMIGMLKFPNSSNKYYFSCEMSDNLYGFIWINDHLFCSNNVYGQPTVRVWNITYENDIYTSRQAVIRGNFYSNSVSLSSSFDDYNFKVLWSHTRNTTDTFSVINESYLEYNSSNKFINYANKRVSISNDAINNTWSTWLINNMMTIVRLPDSFGYTIGICTGKNITGDCLTKTIVQDDYLTPGLHAIDHSYFNYSVTWKDVLLNYEYSIDIEESEQQNKYTDLYAKIENPKSNNDQTVFVAVSCNFLWNRIGNVNSHNNYKNYDRHPKTEQFTQLFSSQLDGFDNDFTLYSSIPPMVLNDSNNNLYYLFPLQRNESVLYLTTNPQINATEDIDNITSKYKTMELSRYEYFNSEQNGNLSDVQIGIETILMYNLIYTPCIGIFGVISRAWVSGNSDFDLILFDWDNIFGAYLYGFVSVISNVVQENSSYNNRLIELASNYAILTYLAIVKSKTEYGFVPNYVSIKSSQFGDSSICPSNDRTEPPIGAITLYKLYRALNKLTTRSTITIDMDWLMDYVINDLYDWQDWFWNWRRCSPVNLICLGSNINPPLTDASVNTKQGAQYESGLDNSPMWDEALYNNGNNATNTFNLVNNNRMLLYDTGFTSLVASEISYILKLYQILQGDIKTNMNNSNNSKIETLNQRYSFFITGMKNYLWNDTYKLFVNRLINKDGTLSDFNFRMSPTYFYPLMLDNKDYKNNQLFDNISQVEFIIDSYLMSNKYFCINYDFPNNQTNDCFYGLPSIGHSDENFKDQNYWRGLTWGPMVQLTFWGMENWMNNSSKVLNATNALIVQMKAMFLNVWHQHRHVCENFSPSNQINDCTGDQFYYWGALSGLISFIQKYYQ